MDPISAGTGIRDAILAIAGLFTIEYWPGLISLLIFTTFLVLVLVMGTLCWHRKSLLDGLRKDIQSSGDAAGFQSRLNAIEGRLSKGKSLDARRLASAFSEFRETLLEPAHNGAANIRNAFRPSTFINLEDLRFSLVGWRVWPGLFVSVGLLFTFLGLIAALAATKHIIDAGGGSQQQVTHALEGLLDTASAKFIMSLTGLFCSILFTILQRSCSGLLGHSVSELNHVIERRMDFVSLEGIADRQLAAIKEQTTLHQHLNAQLIAELSKPLERMSASGVEAIGAMAGELSATLSSNLSSSIDRVAERIDGAAATLTTLSGTLEDGAKSFQNSVERSIAGLDVVFQRMALVADQLNAAAENVASTTTPVMETAKSTAQTAQALASGSMGLIEAAKAAVDAERSVVVTSAHTIEGLVRAFEERAKAYDGQLENAFKTYLEQVQRTLSELKAHSDGVHDRYADALHVLQAAVENARTFIPESETNNARPDA